MCVELLHKLWSIQCVCFHRSANYTDLWLDPLYCVGLQAYSVSWLLCRMRAADGVFTAFCLQGVFVAQSSGRSSCISCFSQYIICFPLIHICIHLVYWGNCTCTHTHTQIPATFTCFPFVWCIFYAFISNSLPLICTNPFNQAAICTRPLLYRLHLLIW